MSSLLSSFSFGQRQAYFSLELTIHELRDVPLVTGNFQAKWRVDRPHTFVNTSSTAGVASSVAGGGGSNLSKLLHHAHQDNSDDEDNEGGETHHSHQQSTASADTTLQAVDPSSKAEARDSFGDAPASPSSSKGFLSHLFHRRHHKESPTASSSRLHFDHASDIGTGEDSSHRNSFSSASASTRSPKRQPRRSNVSQGDERHRVSLDVGIGPHQEPRGSTDWHRVQDHSVKWEQVVHAGIRVPLEKPRPPHSGANSLTVPGTPESGDVSPQRGMRHKSSGRSLREDRERDELAAAWGSLGDSELRIIIRQDVATDSHASSNPHQLGHVTLNLAEHAPCPRTPQHYHHHNHHHHHHLHHHHHNPHHPVHHAEPTLRRTETRRFLLQESKTNASLQLTISLTHVGGSREYSVPPVRRGLVVGTLTGVADELMSPSSNVDDADADDDNERGNIGSHHRDASTKSTTSVPSSAVKPRSQVSQHLDHLKHAGGLSQSGGRIPSKNFKKGFETSALASIKTSGIPVSLMNTGAVGSRGERTAKLNGLQYSFSGAASWERDPEQIVDALFKDIHQPAKMARPNAAVGDDSKRHSYASSFDSKRRSGESSRDVNTGGSTNGKRKCANLLPGSKRMPSDGTVKVRPSIKRPGSSSSAHSSSDSRLSVRGPSMGQRSKSIPSGLLSAPFNNSTVKKNPSSGPSSPELSRKSSANRIASGSSQTSEGETPRRVKWKTDSNESHGDPPPLGSARKVLDRRQENSSSSTTDTSTDWQEASQDSPSPSLLAPSSSRSDQDKTPTKSVRQQRPQRTNDNEDASRTIGEKSNDTNLRQHRSRGTLGIDPDDAELQGYRGLGWRARKENAPRRERTPSPPLDFEISRPSSPFALGLGLLSPKLNAGSGRARTPSPQSFSLAIGDVGPSVPALSPPARNRINGLMEEQDDQQSAAPSLHAYVQARLGKPRSKTGLREGDTERSVSGAPQPSVVQGDAPWPLPLMTRPGVGDLGHTAPTKASSESKEDVPALIPGAHPVRHAPHVVVSDTYDTDQEQARKADSPAHGASHEGGLAWADAQTELEAQRGDQQGVSITSTTTSLKPPPLSALHPPNQRRNGSASSSLMPSPQLTGRSSPTPSTSTSPTPSSKTIRRSRSSASVASTRSTASSIRLYHAASLVDNRPGGVPMPSSYVVRSGSAA